MAALPPTCSTSQSRQCLCFQAATRTCRRRRAPRSPYRDQPAAPQRRAIRVASVQASNDVKVGLFPAGKQQAKLQLPVVLFAVEAGSVADDAFQAEVDAAIQAGATGLLLRDNDAGGGSLFEAAIRLKALLRGRAILLIEDRVDIASAAQADGVLLTSRGVPIVVARSILSDAALLVGRTAASAAEAATAAADGANFILLQGAGAAEGAGVTPDMLAAAAAGQRSGLQVPLVVDAARVAHDDVAALLAAGLDGVCGGADVLREFAACAPGAQAPQSLGATVAMLKQGIQERGCVLPPQPGAAAPAAGMLSRLLNSRREEVLAAEKEVMADVLEFLASALPELEETKLLRDAVAALDEAFLVVVVGEFNSGKSTVINALLGERFLEDGILPTTNEISVLRYADNGQISTSKSADGLFERLLPAELLTKLNIVDTPGTNVILERQQRLTEEFVPRADLVLFIMSADRACTDSEVKFLRYIRQWGKKVVFVLNKVDIFHSPDDVRQVTEFVLDNATRLLGVSSAHVIPVSARLALQAKLAAGSEAKGGVLTSVDLAGPLAQDPAWAASRFMSLESFMLDFLTGTTPGAAAGQTGESVRLKLQTPIFVADALLAAAQRQLEAELDVATRELAAVEAVAVQMAKFRREMSQDGSAQRAVLRKNLLDASKRAEAAVNDLLQLSNLSVLTSYIFADKNQSAKSMPLAVAFEASLDRSAISEVPKRLEEHGTWLQANISNQLASYRAFAQQRAPEGASLASPASPAAPAGAKLAVSPREINAHEMALELEGEVRDVVLGTASSAGGAAAFGTVLTAILPTTLEDLLAVALAGSAAYMALLNLPIKRGEIKAAVQARYDKLSARLEKEMVDELEAGLQEFEVKVDAMVKPLEFAAKSEIESVKQLQSQLEDLQERLAAIKLETANL